MAAIGVLRRTTTTTKTPHTASTSTMVTSTWVVTTAATMACQYALSPNKYESLVSLYIGVSNALGIAAASFAERSDSGASKDRAESPTAELEAEPERPKKGTKGMRI